MSIELAKGVPANWHALSNHFRKRELIACNQRVNLRMVARNLASQGEETGAASQLFRRAKPGGTFDHAA